MLLISYYLLRMSKSHFYKPFLKNRRASFVHGQCPLCICLVRRHSFHQHEFYTGRLMLEILALCIVIPIVEELLYRGIVLQRCVATCAAFFSFKKIPPPFPSSPTFLPAYNRLHIDCAVGLHTVFSDLKAYFLQKQGLLTPHSHAEHSCPAVWRFQCWQFFTGKKKKRAGQSKPESFSF